ncbi:MAG: anion permease [Actinobacteria bacterium]|nr:anion permease [Actinomycetota bacterium]
MSELIITKYVLLFFTVIFFAMNMGASGIAPSFAALYGGKLISYIKAALLYAVFVIGGGVLLGHNVVRTLSGKLISTNSMTVDVALIILFSASMGLFVANLVYIPQSTSWTTVFAIAGAGLGLNQFKFKTMITILPYWILLPIVSFALTYFLYRIIYPPRQSNLNIYRILFCNEKKVRGLALASSCYIALAIGSNNVANAVGPITGAKLVSPVVGLAAIAPFFGLGGLLFGKKNMLTIGREIAPLGLISSSLVSIVTASLLIFASLMGIPQSLVQLGTASVFAIGTVKNGGIRTFKSTSSRKIFLTWIITPFIAFWVAFILVKVFLGR